MCKITAVLCARMQKKGTSRGEFVELFDIVCSGFGQETLLTEQTNTHTHTHTDRHTLGKTKIYSLSGKPVNLKRISAKDIAAPGESAI